MADPFKGSANPFGDSSLYDINTTYVPPDLIVHEEAPVDAVVPAIVPVAAAGAAPAAAAAAAGGRAAAAATVPAVAAPLQFTESHLSSTRVTGNIGQASSSARTGAAAPLPAAGGGFGGGGGGGANNGGGGFSNDDDDDASKYPLWNVRRYRPFFNVDTSDVVWRVGSSFLGPFRPDFMEATMARPDLYGPFWIATTLVFVTAVAGNYAEFLAWSRSAAAAAAAGDGGAGGGGGSGNGTAPIPAPGGGASGGGASGQGLIADLRWYADYAKMSYSAALVYGYVFVLGGALYFALRWFRSEIRLANVWCIYGYSLTIFVPMAFACIPPLGWLRWLAVGAATALSGAFVAANLKAAIYEAAPARAVLLLAIILAAHAGVGLALRLYFFAY